MKLVRVGRKWVVEGNGDGWIFNKTFPSKWKAEMAIQVFENGGRVSDYLKLAREQQPSKRQPRRAIADLNRALEQINVLKPTCEEIEEYGAKEAGYGEVSYTRSTKYHPPSLHDTWGAKQGGRVHINIGCRGVHLMLDRRAVWRFIEFIKRRRGKPQAI